MKDWSVLKDREIIEMFIGDSVIERDFGTDYKMPYMRGTDICELGIELGISEDYWDNNSLSRWVYMKDVIDYVIRNNIIDSFFKKLLDLSRFREIRKYDSYKSSRELYYEIINMLMYNINEILVFNKCHIEYNFKTWKFSLIDDESTIRIETENINKIDRQYIKRLKSEIESTIKSGDYESCITKSRTLIEEVFKYGIEEKQESVDSKGDIVKLHSKFKDLYNMHQDKQMDKRINSLLSGFDKIITSISEMRDLNSDSHGAGSKRIKIEKHHAILFSNAAIVMSEFFLSVINNKK